MSETLRDALGEIQPKRDAVRQRSGGATELPGDLAGLAIECFELIASLLQAGWVHVALPGYLVAHPDLDVSDFGSRSATRTSNGGTVTQKRHVPDFTAGVPDGQFDRDLDS